MASIHRTGYPSSVLLWVVILPVLSVVYLSTCISRRLRKDDSGAWDWDCRFNRVFLAVFLLMPVHLVVSEFWYRKHIVPVRVTNIAKFYERFGEPDLVRAVQRDGAQFYHLHGRMPPFYVLALPSETAAYVFNQNGHFLEWCRDTGDDGGVYWEKWPREEGRWLDPESFRQDFER